MKISTPPTIRRFLLLVYLTSPFLLSDHSYSDEVPREIRDLSQKDIDKGVEGRNLWKKEKDRAEPGYVVVKSSGVAWVYKSPPHTGNGHGDGVASFDLSGLVVDSAMKPVAGARFIEKPTRQFGGVDKDTERAATKANGTFSFEASVGAAFSMGEFGGDVYQSRLKTFVVSCEGYRPLEITIGYGCPNLLIQLTKTGAEQDGTGQPAIRPESDSEGGDKPQPEAEGRSR